MGVYTSIITLGVGDIVIDRRTKESGILLRCINLFEGLPLNEYDLPGVNAWEILWAGSALPNSIARMQVYTENGLINMIHEGMLELYKNN